MKNQQKRHIDFLDFTSEKKTGFTLPENYFKELEAELFLKIKTVDTSSPKEGFLTPENYLETSRKEIFKQTNSLQKRKVIFLNTLKTVASIAAIFLLYFGIQTTKSTPPSTSFDSLTDVEINTWLITNQNIVLEDYTVTSTASVENFSEDILTKNDLLFYLTETAPDLIY